MLDSARPPCPARRMWIGAALLALAAVSACRSEGGVPAFRHAALYEHVHSCADGFLLVDGEWPEDFDDAAFYGPAYFARAGFAAEDAEQQEIARRAFARNREIVKDANLATGDVNLIAMSAMGMVEHIAASGEPDGKDELDQLIAQLVNLVGLLGHYVPESMVPGYAMQTYGPVAINALMALLPAQRAAVLGQEGAEAMVDFVQQVAAELKERHWDGSAYGFGGVREGLFLYPNVAMLILNARLFQLTDDAAYKEHALAIYQGIQPLKVKAGDGLVGVGRYRSPYSAVTMGAKTDDYTTLSSQNYVLLALMLLHELTGDARLIEEVDTILDFIEDHLLGDACAADIGADDCAPACAAEQACLKQRCHADRCHCGVLHHWMDGRVATPADPEFFCSGCNLQLLYDLWYRQSQVRAPGQAGG